MTPIRWPLKPKPTHEEAEKMVEEFKKNYVNIHNAMDSFKLNWKMDKYGAKWDCEHGIGYGECQNPECIAEFIHEE